MLEVILDTETTGLSTLEKHRIVEIGCVELNNQIPTDKIFHTHINPQRSVSEEAYKIHGYSDEFLSNKKTFSEIAEAFLNFIKDKKIVIHNASFDLSFINYELNKSIINNTLYSGTSKIIPYGTFAEGCTLLLEEFKRLEDTKTNPNIKNFFDKAKRFWKN